MFDVNNDAKAGLRRIGTDGFRGAGAAGRPRRRGFVDETLEPAASVSGAGSALAGLPATGFRTGPCSTPGHACRVVETLRHTNMRLCVDRLRCHCTRADDLGRAGHRGQARGRRCAPVQTWRRRRVDGGAACDPGVVRHGMTRIPAGARVMLAIRLVHFQKGAEFDSLMMIVVSCCMCPEYLSA